MDELVKSIQKMGIVQPLQIVPDGRVIDGEMRRQAAIKLGMEEVAVIVHDMNEQQIAEYQAIRSEKYIPTTKDDMRRAISMLLKNHTVEQIAKLFGKTVEWVKAHARA